MDNPPGPGRRRLLLVVPLLLAVAAIAWWRSGGSGDGGPGGRTAAPDRAAAVASLGNRALNDYRAGALGGRVVAAKTGAPIVGATVSASLLGLDFGARMRSGDEVRAELPTATTDAAGRFRLPGLAPGRWSVSAAAPGFKPGTLAKVELGAEATVDDLELRLVEGGSRLSGTISDMGGGPVEGAIVSAQAQEVSIAAIFRAPFAARSDAAGRYVLDLDDGSYALTVRHADYVDERTTVRVKGATTKDVKLTPGGRIEGVVLRRSDDQPVAGALVAPDMTEGQFILSGVGFAGVVTDADGAFALRGLPAGAIRLRASAPGHASPEATTVELAIAEQATGVVVYVDRAASIRGKVVAKGDERPIAGALVGAYNFAPGAAFVASDPTGEDGGFAIHGVLPGSYTMGAATDGRVPNPMADGVTVADRDVEGVVIRIDAGATLRGRVEPPTAAEISLAPTGEFGLGAMPAMVGAAMVHGQAAADGAFELAAVPGGTFAVVARTPDGREGELEVEVSGDRDGLVVALEPRAAVAGIVVDEGGRPVADADVGIEPTEREGRRFRFDMGRRAGHAATGADGRFEVLGLEDGPHEVSVSDGEPLAWAGKSGEAARAPMPLAIAAATPVRDLRLVVESRREALRGTVLGADGAPAVDAWVTATFAPPDDGDDAARSRRRGASADEERESRRRTRRWRASEEPVLTDDAGRFAIEGLRKGRYDLRAEVPTTGARGELEGAASGTTVSLRLESLGEVHGRVTRAGAPVTAFTIEIGGAGGADGPDGKADRFANREGRYRVTRLEAGEYTVSVSADGGRASGKVKLAAGGEANLDLQLIAYGSVRGVAIDSTTGKPVAGLRAIVMTEEGNAGPQQMMEAMAGTAPRTDAEGRFRVGRLGSGKGTLMLFGDDAMTPFASRELTLAIGQELDLGRVEGVATPAVPEDRRGVIGLETDVDTWRERPDGAGADDAPPPAGTGEDTRFLWVDSVRPDGPAAAAGVAPGDRIVAIDGVRIDKVGAIAGSALLDESRLVAGSSLTLALQHPGAAERTVTLEVAPAKKK